MCFLSFSKKLENRTDYSFSLAHRRLGSGRSLMELRRAPPGIRTYRDTSYETDHAQQHNGWLYAEPCGEHSHEKASDGRGADC